MDVVVRRCVGMDVSKRDAKVCVRVQGRGSIRTTTEVSTWSSMYQDIERLRDALVEQGVELIVMESTSDYWRPFYYVLSEEIPTRLVKASDVKAMPGRKTDVSDAEWLADLGAHGLVRASFVPAEPIRHLRELCRARVTLTQERTREMQRLEKLLEDACIKLSAVVSDMQGKSARAILAAVLDHQDDPQVLADLAKGRLRAKIDRLKAAMHGRVSDHHRFMIRFRLQRVDRISADIAELDARIDNLVAEHDLLGAVTLLQTVPGIGVHGAHDLIAEIGTDMSVFPSPQALASWIGVAPASHESAGRHRPAGTRPGNRYAKRALGIAAKSAARMRDGFLQARFKRICARRGYGKALVAIQRTMVTAIWHMLTTGECYRDLGADHHANHPHRARRLQRSIIELREAGYQIQAPDPT